ncbi:hypothetical protein ACFQ3Z_01220 [Streptomyces nogalater]
MGVEGTGMIYGYVLTDSGSYTRIASFSSGMSGVMELQWEPQASRLWAVCDDTCDGRHRTLKIDTTGVFTAAGVFNRPSGMPDYNNEGFTLVARTNAWREPSLSTGRTTPTTADTLCAGLHHLLNGRAGPARLADLRHLPRRPAAHHGGPHSGKARSGRPAASPAPAGACRRRAHCRLRRRGRTARGP